jgi:hypothetical protein
VRKWKGCKTHVGALAVTQCTQNTTNATMILTVTIDLTATIALTTTIVLTATMMSTVHAWYVR